jgi:hypothetical protein
MKKGLFQLAQSKYSSCGQGIGQHQYNLEPHKSMQVVQVSSDGDSTEFKITQRMRVASGDVDDDSEEEDLDWPSPSESSSNNMGKEGLNLRGVSDMPRQRSNRTTASRDPLSWFGLPSHSLKEAKSSFLEALQVIASLASAKEELKSFQQSNSL